jgi:hypothetical protein
MRLLALVSIVAGFLLTASPLEARDVEIRVLVVDLSAIDTVAQSFTANLSVVMRWSDPSLAHGGDDSISMSLDDIWHPIIQVINQRQLTSTLPRNAEILPQGDVIYRQRYLGVFSQPLDLAAFPFDSQQLQIRLANVGFGGETVNLIPSAESGILESFSIPDWTLTEWDLKATKWPLDKTSPPVDGMLFTLDLDRDGGYFIYKVIMPLLLIVMMSWLVFWIDPSLGASQINLAVTSVLTVIAYRFVLEGMIPRLTFLTSLDYFVLGSTVVVFLSLAEVIYTGYLFTHGRLELAQRVDRIARWAAPLTFALIALATRFLRVAI